MHICLMVWKKIGTMLVINDGKFTNIKPGDYNFKLKAANNDGLWTNEPKQFL